MVASGDGTATPPIRLQLVSPDQTRDLGRLAGPLPKAPLTLEVTRLRLAAGRYSAIRVGQLLIPGRIVVERGQVEPLLVGFMAGAPVPGGVWAGNDDYNLGLSELAGELVKLDDFKLQDQAGKALDLASIVGHETVIAAFHTTCRETCPLYTGLLLQLQKRISSDVRLLEVTTDPITDTSPALLAYAREVGAAWTFATGDDRELAAFWSQFGVGLSGLDEHTSTLALVDAHGYIRIVYRGVPDVGGSLPAPLDSRLSAQGRTQLHSAGPWGAAQIVDALQTISRPGADPVNYGPRRQARDFTLTSFNGRQVSLSQLRGRPLVINFFASWCAPCRVELPLLEQQAAIHPELTFVLIDVSDRQSAAADLLSRLHVRTPVVLSDPDGATSAAYGVPGLPTTVFVRADGSIAVQIARQIDSATLGAGMAAAAAG